MAGHPPVHPLQRLTEKQERFVKLFVETGCAHTAALASGYSETTAKTGIYWLLNTPHIARAIALEVRQRLATAAPIALARLIWLVNHAQHEKVQADAAKAILDRAGYLPPRPKDEKPSDRALNEMSVDELRDLANKLEQERAAGATIISAELAQPGAQAGAEMPDLLG